MCQKPARELTRAGRERKRKTYCQQREILQCNRAIAHAACSRHRSQSGRQGRNDDAKQDFKPALFHAAILHSLGFGLVRPLLFERDGVLLAGLDDTLILERCLLEVRRRRQLVELRVVGDDDQLDALQLRADIELAVLQVLLGPTFGIDGRELEGEN